MNSDPNRDEEWEAWAADFRHPPDATAHPEVTTILARAQRDSWIHVAKAALELAGYAIGFAVFGYLSTKVRAVWPMASVAFGVFAIAVVYSVHVRKHTWAAAGHDVAAFVELAYRRKRADVRLVIFGQLLLAALGLAFAVWLPYVLATTPDPLTGTWFAAPVRVVFAVAVIAGTAFHLSRKLARERRALARLEQLRVSLRGEPSGNARSVEL